MATDSSSLAWRIPRTEEPGGLQSVGLQRVRHNLATKPPPPPGSDGLRVLPVAQSLDPVTGFLPPYLLLVT